MLSIQTLKGSSGGQLASYFEKESAQKDYWANEAQHATVWHGRGTAELGLSGPVDQQTFESLIEGRLPDGTQLAHGAAGKRRLGYDLTFSAPKSVSLQGLVFDDKRILDAHDTAVRRALDWTEKESAQTRIKHHGQVTTEKTGNLAAAVFRHETSRNLDPQLHSHAVVPNMTRSADGSWRALDASEVFRNKMAAGAVYRNELSGELKNLGYEVRITDKQKGTFEIKGYSDKQLAEFSSRRNEIKAELAKAAHPESAKAAESAALNTRQRKQSLGTGEKDKLRDTWKAQTHKSGIRQAKAGKHADCPLPLDMREKRGRQIVSAALSDMSKGHSTFTPQQLRGRAMQRSVGSGVRPQDVQRSLDRAMASGKVIQMDNGRMATRQSLSRGSRNSLARTLAWQVVPAPIRQAIGIARAASAMVRAGANNQAVSVKSLIPMPKPLRLLGKLLPSLNKSNEKSGGMHR